MRQDVRRELSETHPWITFQIDLRRAGHDLWLALGEAKGLLQTIAGMPLLPDIRDALYGIYLAKGALATVAIEGNTLTEAQAIAQVKGELKLPPSQKYLAHEMQNIVDACSEIGDRLGRGEKVVLSPELLEDFNARVLANEVPITAGAVPGRLRRPGEDVVVSVVGYRGVPGRLVRPVVAHLCEWLESPDLQSDEEELKLPYAVARAIAAHLYITWIHPFGDGNGRTARLVELLLLLKSGIPKVSTHLLSNHYNLTRSAYYASLDYASRSGGDAIPFFRYAARGLADLLFEQVEAIKSQQLELVFEHHVREVLRIASAERAQRQHALVMALARQWPKPVARADVRYVTPQVAKAYDGRTTKTLTRDLHELQEHDLVIRTEDGLKANLDALKAFVPPQY